MRGKTVLAGMIAALAFGVVACGRGETYNSAGAGAASETAFPNPPTRAVFDGCAWEHVEGAGVRLWSQACHEEGSFQRLIADESAPILWREAVLDGQVMRSVAVQVFSKDKAAPLDSILASVFAAAPAPAGATCAFGAAAASDAQSANVKRYALVPVGETRTAYERTIASGEVAAPPCGAMGPTEAGERYFEVHDAHPDKVVFVELGSDLPIFEYNTLEVVAADAKGKDAHAADGHGDGKH
jgi:hypothetical protein